MRIALITNTAPHHKYFVCELCDRYNVRLVLHPSLKRRERAVSAFRSGSLLKYGYTWFLMKLLSVVYNKLVPCSMGHSIARAEQRFFQKYVSRYAKLDRRIIHHVNSVNDATSCELIRNNEIDVLCFLGGDIAKSAFINSARVAALNYHSGVSPFYNGNKTIFHAVADGRPNFAGGTLMYITERIDGGGILAHYLPHIEQNDNAATLFMKGIQGAVKLYDKTLQDIENGKMPEGIVQERSFRYCMNIDWTLMNDLRLHAFEKRALMKKYLRHEQAIFYDETRVTKLEGLYSKALKAILGREELLP